MFSVIFALTSTALFAADATRPSAPAMATANNAISPVVQQINPDVRLIQYSNGASVEQLKGEAAYKHLQNVMSRHPQAFLAARKEMEKRGYLHPTMTVFVERTLRSVHDSGSQQAQPYSLTQTSGESNADGEIDFWSYDSADSVWAGTIYIELYSTGDASTWDGELDESTTDYPWNWTTETWAGTGGGGGGPKQVKLTRPPMPGDLTRAAGIMPASLRNGHGDNMLVFDWLGWSECWRGGVIGGCSGAAVACLRVGPAWPGCWGAVCAGVEVGTGITCAFKY
jgi:hypothetical protein